MKKVKFRQGRQLFQNTNASNERTLEIVPHAPEKKENTIQQVGSNILSHMLDTIERNVTDIPFFASKEHDVHPLYKFVFQEIVKRSFDPAYDEDDSPLATIGIEGFDASQL